MYEPPPPPYAGEYMHFVTLRQSIDWTCQLPRHLIPWLIPFTSIYSQTFCLCRRVQCRTFDAITGHRRSIAISANYIFAVTFHRLQLNQNQHRETWLVWWMVTPCNKRTTNSMKRSWLPENENEKNKNRIELFGSKTLMELPQAQFSDSDIELAMRIRTKMFILTSAVSISILFNTHPIVVGRGRGCMCLCVPVTTNTLHYNSLKFSNNNSSSDIAHTAIGSTSYAFDCTMIVY